MFGTIPPTAYDLNFRLFNIPIRVHPGFWLVAAIMGWSGTMLQPTRGPLFLLLWIGILFFSILVHELGHALTAQKFGYPPEIVLYHFGGLAMYRPGYGYTTSRSVAISFMGPMAGFLLFGLVYGAAYAAAKSGYQFNQFERFFIEQMVWVNLMWGLVNLLPVYPLDGGQITHALCRKKNPYRGSELTFQIGMVVGAMIGGVFVYLHQAGQGNGLYPAFLFFFLAFNNFQMLQATQGRGY